MFSRNKKKHKLKISNQTIEQVQRFRYLWAIITYNRKSDEEINGRISSTNKIYHALSKGFLNKKEVTTRTKAIVYKTVYQPILTYSSESYALTSHLHSRLQASEMKYLRWTVNKTRKDRMRNQTIRSTLQLEPLSSYTEWNQLQWYGHMVRMSENRLLRKAWECKPVGRWGKRCPRSTWNENVMAALEERNIDGRAADRNRWRSLCSTSTPVR